MASRSSSASATGPTLTGAASSRTAAFSSAVADVDRARRISAEVRAFGSASSGNSDAIVRRRVILSCASGVNLLAGSFTGPGDRGMLVISFSFSLSRKSGIAFPGFTRPRCGHNVTGIGPGSEPAGTYVQAAHEERHRIVTRFEVSPPALICKDLG